MEPTLVTFPDGSLTGQGVVVLVHPHADGAVVVTDSTPFHPVDHTWPDQPGDHGRLSSGGESVQITECVMAAISDEGEFAVGAEIPVKRGAPGWVWLVGHVIDAEQAPAWLIPSVEVSLSVDARRRAGLSRGHTACHLASLALDLSVASLWRKDPGEDALGSPDFEGRANQSSRIHLDGSVDEYRLGKSLRKAGFDTEGFAATMSEREAHINDTLARWVAAGASSEVITEGPTIIDRRSWRCELPEGTAVIPCGGTHAHTLAEFAQIRVELTMDDTQTLVMTTSAVPSA